MTTETFFPGRGTGAGVAKGFFDILPGVTGAFTIKLSSSFNEPITVAPEMVTYNIYDPNAALAGVLARKMEPSSIGAFTISASILGGTGSVSGTIDGISGDTVSGTIVSNTVAGITIRLAALAF